MKTSLKAEKKVPKTLTYGDAFISKTFKLRLFKKCFQKYASALISEFQSQKPIKMETFTCSSSYRKNTHILRNIDIYCKTNFLSKVLAYLQNSRKHKYVKHR